MPSLLITNLLAFLLTSSWFTSLTHLPYEGDWIVLEHAADHEEGEGEEEQEELRALKEHRYRLEERQRAEEEMRAKLRRSVPGAEPRPASRGTQSEASGSADAAARADADEHDGAGDALPPTPRPATADPATGWAPCAEAKPADAPERMGPKIVTHRIDDGSRLEIRKDVSHLPYMHRNPAV